MSMQGARRGDAAARAECRSRPVRVGCETPPRRRHPAAWAAAAGIAVLLVLVCGCAYFNTFYNAKQLYKRGEIERATGGPTAGGGSYQLCIDKCLLLLKYYPKSRYADDALFMIGMCHLYRGEYVQARASFEDLVDRFPDSDFAERTYYNMGLAALRQGDAAASAEAFEMLQKHFPDSPLRIEAVFRTAESRLDTHDFEAARRDLRAFIQDHPGSSLVAEAQLRMARTYYDETRYEEARREYALVLKEKISPEVRLEAELNSALALRAQAEMILSDPALHVGSQTSGPAPGPAAPAAVDSAAGEEEAPSDSSEALDNTDALHVEGALAGAEAASDPGDTTVAGEAAAAPAAVAARDTSVATSAAALLALPEPPEDPAAVEARAAQRRQADEILTRVQKQLESLRKPAAKLGKQFDLRIELAVTHALQGASDGAIADLDQVARTQPHTDVSAKASYQIGEIQRRRGDLEKARAAYDAVPGEKRDSPLVEPARKKSAAIMARAAALEQLKQAPEALRAWRVAHRLDGAGSQGAGDKAVAAQDSLEARIAIDTKFEAMASQLLHIAEIDLLDLDQPLLALRELQKLRADFPGSLQDAPAAFAVGWIYEHRLRDSARARQAYEIVVRDCPGTPQAGEAKRILEQQAPAGSSEEGPQSSQP